MKKTKNINKIPYSILPFNLLKKTSEIFMGLGSNIVKRVPSLKLNVQKTGMTIGASEYVAMSITSSFIFFISVYILFNIVLFALEVGKPPFVAFFISIVLTFFIFMQQIFYPSLFAKKQIRGIEQNLLPALQDMLVQLNSGIPLFTILVNLSNKDYGELSREFGKAVKEIHAGVPQIEVLDKLASQNPSLYFRRSLWQLVNGMKTGSNTAIVVKEIIESLSEERLIQIQKYGGQLNPLAMFYMLITVILPSLGMTFLITISSFVATSEVTTKAVFWSMYVFVVFFQIMFMGLIKARRPTLLEI